MSEVQILLLLLLSGYLISVSLGMAIIPRILVISHKKRYSWSISIEKLDRSEGHR